MTKVKGYCPMGCGKTLFLGDGGYVTCSWIDCPRPTAATDVLELDHDHHVVFDAHTFTVEHPVRERIEGTMHGCDLHQAISRLAEPPMPPGRYRAARLLVDGSLLWRFEAVAS